MLPLPHRLPTQDVSRVMRQGKRMHSDTMTVVYARQETPLRQGFEGQAGQGGFVESDSTSLAKPRFAFVVGVKASKKAVERNRVKRLLRESAHHILPQVLSGFDIVIVAKKELVGMSQEQVEVVMVAALKTTALI